MSSGRTMRLPGDEVPPAAAARALPSRNSSLRNPFFAIEPRRVLHGNDDYDQPHPNEPNQSADIEQPITSAEKMHDGLPEQGQVPDREQDPQLRRTEPPERKTEFPQSVRRQVRLNRQHQEADQQPRGDPRMHVARQRE